MEVFMWLTSLHDQGQSVLNQTHGMVWVGRDLQRSSCLTLLPWTGTCSTTSGCSKPFPAWSWTLPGGFAFQAYADVTNNVSGRGANCIRVSDAILICDNHSPNALFSSFFLQMSLLWGLLWFKMLCKSSLYPATMVFLVGQGIWELHVYPVLVLFVGLKSGYCQP